MSLQLVFNMKKNMWSAPNEFKDLSGYSEIAIDLETRDEGINKRMGADHIFFFILNTNCRLIFHPYS